MDDVDDYPNAFYGKTVTLYGEVDEVMDAKSFMLEGNGLVWDDEIPVLTRSAVRLEGRAPEDDDRLVVRGTIHPFVIADVEKEIGWDLDPQLEIRLKETPVMVADQIHRMGDRSRWTADEPKGVVLSLVTVVLAADPASLVGESIVLDHALVQGKQGDGVWLGDSQRSQVFVVPAEGVDISALATGVRADLQGTIRKMPAPEDAMKAWSLPDAVRAELKTQPVYIEATDLAVSTGLGDET